MAEKTEYFTKKNNKSYPKNQKSTNSKESSMKNIVRNAYAKFQRATLNSLAANRNKPKAEMRTTATPTRPTRNLILNAIFAIFHKPQNLKFLELRHAAFSNVFRVAGSIEFDEKYA